MVWIVYASRGTFFVSVVALRLLGCYKPSGTFNFSCHLSGTRCCDVTHTGYGYLLIKDKRRLALGTFYHQLHHRYYECNYGNQEMPWDRWFFTFNDGTEEATRVTRERKKKMHA